jgi:hypothetical protein
MTIAGIDPGLTRAIARLDGVTGVLADVCDMPIFQINKAKTSRIVDGRPPGAPLSGSDPEGRVRLLYGPKTPASRPLAQGAAPGDPRRSIRSTFG